MHVNEYNDLYSKTFYILLYMGIFTIIPNILLAGTSGTKDNAISKAICNIVNALTGNIGQGLSTIAIIFIGIGLFMGKISWGLALGIALGIAMLFGAGTVVGWISGDSVSTCTGGDVTK